MAVVQTTFPEEPPTSMLFKAAEDDRQVKAERVEESPPAPHLQQVLELLKYASPDSAAINVRAMQDVAREQQRSQADVERILRENEALMDAQWAEKQKRPQLLGYAEWVRKHYPDVAGKKYISSRQAASLAAGYKMYQQTTLKRQQMIWDAELQQEALKRTRAQTDERGAQAAWTKARTAKTMEETRQLGPKSATAYMGWLLSRGEPVPENVMEAVREEHGHAYRERAMALERIRKDQQAALERQHESREAVLGREFKAGEAEKQRQFKRETGQTPEAQQKAPSGPVTTSGRIRSKTADWLKRLASADDKLYEAKDVALEFEREAAAYSPEQKQFVSEQIASVLPYEEIKTQYEKGGFGGPMVPVRRDSGPANPTDVTVALERMEDYARILRLLGRDEAVVDAFRQGMRRQIENAGR
jgi:hypothetical protein